MHRKILHPLLSVLLVLPAWVSLALYQSRNECAQFGHCRIASGSVRHRGQLAGRARRGRFQTAAGAKDFKGRGREAHCDHG